jgi:hypothetical protein
MLGAQSSSTTTFTNYIMISFLVVKPHNMDQIGKLIIYKLTILVNYFLKIILALKEHFNSN